MSNKKLIQEFIEQLEVTKEGVYKVNIEGLLIEFMEFLKTKENGKEEKSKT